jgi:hypothetical protein
MVTCSFPGLRDTEGSKCDSKSFGWLFQATKIVAAFSGCGSFSPPFA